MDAIKQVRVINTSFHNNTLPPCHIYMMKLNDSP